MELKISKQHLKLDLKVNNDKIFYKPGSFK